MKIAVCASRAESLVLFRGPLLRTLAGEGHQVVACAPEQDARVIQVLENWGIEYCPYFLNRTGMNPLLDLKALRELHALFRRKGPELVLSYTAKPVIYGSLAARRAGVLRICSIITGLGYAFTAGGLRRKVVSLLQRTLYRAALKHNQVVYFQNPDDLALFRKLGLVRSSQKLVLVNGSGVDLTVFQETPISPGPVSFLLIARLLKDKGIREFAEAARRLKQRYPAVTFRMLGPTDPNPACIEPELLEGWIQAGILEHENWAEDVRPFIARASVFVLPSYREGTPRSVLEAMAMGRPIITTDAPGCRETVVEGVNGFKVAVRDAQALERVMEQFILEPALASRMGKESRRTAEEKYDVRSVNQIFLNTLGLTRQRELATG